MKACTLTVQSTLTVSLKRQGLVLWVMKIILVGMVATTQSFAAQRIPSPLPSGGLELISNPFGDKSACIPVIKTPKEAIIRIKLIKVIPCDGTELFYRLIKLEIM